MSASPIDPDSISPDIKQGLIAGLLGMLGMAVKIILTDERLKVGKVLMHLFVAMVVAVLSGFALDGYITNKKMLWALNGVSGYMALQITAWAEQVVAARLNKELKAVKVKGGKPRKITNAKPGKIKR
jgi:hypothetical protein